VIGTIHNFHWAPDPSNNLPFELVRLFFDFLSIVQRVKTGKVAAGLFDGIRMGIGIGLPSRT
jgi:hypothetical protein